MRSKLTIKTLERRHWRPSSVFIVNFEHISHLALVSTVNFEQVNSGWEWTFNDYLQYVNLNFSFYWFNIFAMVFSFWQMSLTKLLLGKKNTENKKRHLRLFMTSKIQTAFYQLVKKIQRWSSFLLKIKIRLKREFGGPLLKERLTLRRLQNNKFLYQITSFLIWKSAFKDIFNSLHVWMNGHQEILLKRNVSFDCNDWVNFLWYFLPPILHFNIGLK